VGQVTGKVAKEWVAIILAIGLATAINVITLAVLIDALYSDDVGLSENATQILTTAFGGIIGVLGSYIGYRTARAGIEADADAAAVDAEAAAASSAKEEP
jgi:predicted small secreted protein